MRKFTTHKILSFFLALGLCFRFVFPPHTDDGLDAFAPSATPSAALKNDYCLELAGINAESAVVMDAKSRSVLFSKGKEIARGMASTTKIMTALVAIESCHPDKEFTVPPQAVGIEGSSVYLSAGEPLTLKELLYCLLLESGNDAATAIAICVGGSQEEFVDMMNARAEEMGLKSTRFANPHGLSHEGHYTTAEELALITAEAMEYPLFREIVATKSYTVRRNGKENQRLLNNHNKLLGTYEGALGVKTGYTQKDGKCLVSAAERDGLLLIAVSLKDPAPTSTHKRMLDAAFEGFQRVAAAERGDISARVAVNGGERDFAVLYNDEDVILCLPKGEKFEISLSLPESINAPVLESEVYGTAKVTCKGETVYIINLASADAIKIKEKGLWESLFGD